MSDIVPASEIEGIVGVDRHPTDHWGRAVSAEQTVYILHSAECLASGIDLRHCDYSIALDNGIELSDWAGQEDKPVRLGFDDGWLIPDAPPSRGRVTRLECGDCGLAAMDLPDGVDPELIFERGDDGVMRCQGCQAGRDAGWPKASGW